MIRISSILEELGISYTVTGDECDVYGLGLVSYGPDEKYSTYISDKIFIPELGKNASVVICNHEVSGELLSLGKTVIEVEDPKITFFYVQNYLADKCIEKKDTEISKTAHISESAIISDYNVSIGEHSVIEDNVIIYDGVDIGDNVIIRSGSIIGGQEFEYKRKGKEIFHVRHTGHTIVENDVDIGYNSIIGRAIYDWDKTVVGTQSKLADRVIVGHGAKIGERNMIGAGTVICGRCNIGNDNWIGPNCSISNALAIGSDVHIGIGSVVINNVDDGKRVFGNPARPMLTV